MPSPKPNSNAIIPLEYRSLFILVGPSGAGKSTFTQKKFPKYFTVSTDECRTMICGARSNQGISDDAFDLFYYIIEKKMKHGYPVVADSTALKRKYRNKLSLMAQKYNYQTVLVLFDIPQNICIDNDKSRRYSVGKSVLKAQFTRLEKTKQQLSDEHYDKCITFENLEQIAKFHYRFTNGHLEKTEVKNFDVVANPYGNLLTLEKMLLQLGYDTNNHFQHPLHRKLIFLEIFSPGMGNLAMMRFVKRIIAAQNGYYVLGKYGETLWQKLKNNQDVSAMIPEWQHLSQEEKQATTQDLLELFTQAYPYLILDNGQVVVSHAGIYGSWIGIDNTRVRKFCTHGAKNTKNPFVWTEKHRGDTMIVFGFPGVDQVTWKNNTVNINTYEATGELSILSYPECICHTEKP